MLPHRSTLAETWTAEIPAGVGRQGRLHRRRANPGDVVAVRIDLGDKDCVVLAGQDLGRLTGDAGDIVVVELWPVIRQRERGREAGVVDAWDVRPTDIKARRYGR